MTIATTINEQWTELTMVNRPSHTLMNQFFLISVKESQQQQSDMSPVHIGVSHYDNAVVSQEVDVEIRSSKPKTQRRYHRLDFRVLINLQHARVNMPLSHI